MITRSYLWLDISLGLLAAGLALGGLLLLTWWDKRRQAKADAALHVPQHRSLDGTGGGNVLAPAPVEVIRLADQPTAETPAAQFEGRTEEWPRVETPVVHVEASEEPPAEGAIGTLAAEESPEMADAAWQHDWDQRWTALLVGWAQRPDWLSEFGAGSLQLPEYRRLVLEHTGEITAADMAALVDETKAGAR